MKERLKEFLTKNGFNSKGFALKIGVQPSSVSHILTGRNKPSIEFLEKLLIAFPDMDLKYLITGVKGVDNEVLSTSESTGHDQILVSEQKAVESKEEGKTTNVTSSENRDKVLILHADGTYSEFTQR